MAEKLVIDLTSLIPLNAVAVTIEYKTTSGAKALLHRFEGDQSPVVLNGPGGTVEVNVPQSRKLYLERLDAADWDIGCYGYRI